jgi:3-methyladenine DNA glycosylase/8-oxoguanine DNA glycosylase
LILNLKNAFTVEFDAVPPYSFELTLRKPAGWYWSTPQETCEKGTCWSATRFNGELLGLKLHSIGTIRKPRINCTVYSHSKIAELNSQNIILMLKRALKVEEDLTGFYELSQKDPILQDVVKDLYGMHTIGWPELFPALILAVSLQMAPMKRSNQMMDLLMTNFGEDASFDKKTIRYWPSAQTIANAPVEELMNKAKLGYRAKNLKAIATMLTQNFPSMDELYALKRDEAKKKLLTLFGIGEYSAELVMPQTGFPLDVWSAKIFSVLFNGTVPKNPRNAISALKEMAQKRWGNWSGYAFVYVLNDLPNLSKRISADLTKF